MFHQHALYYNTAFQYDPHKYNVDPPIGYKRKLNEVDSSYLRSRTAANLRERKRMQCINEAFEGLRKHIPTLPYEKRLSKVDTLRLAICYINFLTELISSGGADDGSTDGLLTPNSSRKCNGKIVIYNTTINENKELGFPPLKGHSLSWASDKCDEKLRYVKTTRIWHPEDPMKIKLSTYS